MSFEERLEVPPARSPFSTSRTERPRPAASRAVAAPWMPPPTTTTSKPCTSVLVGCGLETQLLEPGFAAQNEPRHDHAEQHSGHDVAREMAPQVDAGEADEQRQRP